MNDDLKILVVRRDRLGDLLMTLPTLVYLRQAFPNAFIEFCFCSEFHELLKDFLSQWNIQKIDQIEKKYDAALFLKGSLKESWDLIRHRIAIRVGAYSKLSSFFFLTHGIRQKRSLNGKSEAESNLEIAEIMVRRLGSEKRYKKEELLLPISGTNRNSALKRWYQLGLKETDKVAVFHPGMRGSARNLSAQSYLDLILEMESRGFVPVLSTGPEKQDKELREAILQKKADIRLVSGLSLSELAEFFRMASVVIAPSTGPLHLGHWVGVATYGLFSPVKSQHPRRWAPWGGKVPAKILLPKVDCPAFKACWKEKCQAFDCMAQTDWKSLLLAADGV